MRAGGHYVTTGLPRGNITLPGSPVRDRRRLASRRSGRRRQPDARHPAIRVELLDSGQYNAKALVTRVVPLERMLEAYEEVGVPDDGHGHHDRVAFRTPHIDFACLRHTEAPRHRGRTDLPVLPGRAAVGAPQKSESD